MSRCRKGGAGTLEAHCRVEHAAWRGPRPERAQRGPEHDRSPGPGAKLNGGLPLKQVTTVTSEDRIVEGAAEGGNRRAGRLERLRLRLHAWAERRFPEQRLFLRGENSTRYLRLTPQRQVAIVAGLGLFLSWSLFASAAFLVDRIGTGGADSALLQADFEARLQALAAERDERAREAQQAQERFYVALRQISRQQSLLLASEDRRRELETGIEVIQHTLRKAIAERDRARAQSDKLLAELQAVNGNVSTAAGRADEAEATLDTLLTALDRTVAQRDRALDERQKMARKVALLKKREKLMRERNRRIFARLETAVTVSMAPLEKMFQSVGLSTDKLLRDVAAGYSGTGGPLGPVAVSSKSAPEDEMTLRTNRLLKEMDRLNMARIAAESLPFTLPVKAAFRLTSPYGWRRHPISGKRRMHEGLDMAAPYGTPVYATAGGVVTFAGWNGGYGWVVRIRHMDGFETRYAHLAKIRVRKGQRVSRGDRIGDMGSSGRSTGSHVHYEVRNGGKAVNPMKYVKAARNVF